MASNSENNRIRTMIDALEKALAGDPSVTLDLSSEKDELDLLAQTINKLLNRISQSSSSPPLEKKSSPAYNLNDELYQPIFDDIEESYFEVDLQGNLKFFNNAVVRDLNYTPDEIRNINFRNLVDEQNARRLNDVFHHVFLTGKTVKGFDWEVSRKDGSKIAVEASIAPVYNNQGIPCGFRGIVRDISQHKQTEKRLQLITENIRDVIWTRDFDLNYTYVSPSIFRMTGFTADEIIKIPAKSYLQPEQYDYFRKTLALRLRETQEAGVKGPTAVFELELPRKDGTVFWAEISADFNRDKNGIPFEITGVTRDITERKKIEAALRESEQRYRMIVENIHDTISVLDFNLNYIYQSPSEVHVSGYTPEELMKIPSEKQATPESYARGTAMLIEEFEREFSGEPVDPHRSRTFDLEMYHKNGGTVWVEITASFQRDGTGKPVGILLAGRNINERKKAQAEREKLERQLHQVQKMETVGRLAGGVAHDFNNMLGVILGYVDLVQTKLPANHPVIEDIREIEKAASHSRDLTSQLLTFSRKQIIRPRTINLNFIIAEMQKTLIQLIGEDIVLTVHPDRELWTIKFDPLQTEQILINLALNARDAMPQGGQIIIETSNVVVAKTDCEVYWDIPPGSYVLLTVGDTGTGIRKDHLPHIFEPFFSTKDIGKGTGLGLATVYGIVKQNKGEIVVHSEPGQGSLFKIYLPRSGEMDIVREITSKLPAASGSGTILLVEDDKMVLKMVAEMLESLGYMVIASESPLDALSLCEKNKAIIDLVITDVVMPEMSGRELCDKLLADLPELKVLFMSGYTSNIIAQHGILEEGMQFIQKPFSLRVLAAKVRNMIMSG